MIRNNIFINQFIALDAQAQIKYIIKIGLIIYNYLFNPTSPPAPHFFCEIGTRLITPFTA